MQMGRATHAPFGVNALFMKFLLQMEASIASLFV